MKIDKGLGEPLYQQIAQKIAEQIKNKKYKHGTMIPKELELCEMFQVSRSTIRKSLDILVVDKQLNRVKGRGTYVLSKKIEQKYLSSLGNCSYHKEMLEKGIDPKTIVLNKTILPADSVLSQQLKVPLDEPLFRMERLRYGDKIPVLYIVTYMPFLKVPFIYNIDLENNSLYETLTQNDIHIARMEKILELKECTSTIAKYLETETNAPVFYFETSAYTDDDTVIEFSCLHYRGDNNRFYF